MNIKDEVVLFTKRMTEKNDKKRNTKVTPVILNDKLDDFIKWYTNNMVKGHYTDVGEYYQPILMKNLIEKMAVWYELRYTNYEINKLMPYSGEEYTEVNDELFEKSKYFNQQRKNDSQVKTLDLSAFYDTKAFIYSLPIEEQYYFMKPKYKKVIYWDYGHSDAKLYLRKDGIVQLSEHMDMVISNTSKKDFENKNIKEIVEMVTNKGIKIPKNSEFEKVIRDYENWIYQKEEMLNCVMYRIIERGGNRIGPRRAFIFAKEFERSINIPMVYGVDYSDPGLKSFVDDYIKAGGSKELVCYVNYFSRTSKYDKLDTVKISELTKTQYNNSETRYISDKDDINERETNNFGELENDIKTLKKIKK